MGLITGIVIANFNLENPGIGTPKSRDFEIDKQARISGSRDSFPNLCILIKLLIQSWRSLRYKMYHVCMRRFHLVDKDRHIFIKHTKIYGLMD